MDMYPCSSFMGTLWTPGVRGATCLGTETSSWKDSLRFPHTSAQCPSISVKGSTKATQLKIIPCHVLAIAGFARSWYAGGYRLCWFIVHFESNYSPLVQKPQNDPPK